MQRGSNRLSVHKDEEMKHELQGRLRTGHPTRTEEWHDPEPTADDDPEVVNGPVTPGRSPEPVAVMRYELARHLGRTAFPADSARLARMLRKRRAPDALIEPVERLRRGTVYRTVQELAHALVREQEGPRHAPGR
ncbi:hypothetical protein ABT009_12860 [Streptomyces sp. NPDC002896]|uniref:DUF2795 domain-containing protein n=1 Tax=Streptomyces sp. NPDC002896 TaxID=3154438 RepID=UPI00332CCAE7